jgi:hypothetical protein
VGGLAVEVLSVACNNCGAPLEVAPATNFVTCKHCGSQLAIRRTGSSLYTELLEKLDRRTEGMSDQLAEIAYRAELERIDREWDEERRAYLVRDKHGNTHEPNALGAKISAAIAIVFGLFFSAVSCNMVGPMGDGPGLAAGVVPLFGLAMAGYGVYLLVGGSDRARRYEAARKAYQQRRQEVTVDQFRHRDEGPGG